jgi:hypothetical protein
MSKNGRRLMLIACLLCLAPLALAAQQMEEPVYSFVAEWRIPRPQWGDFTYAFERVHRPILEKGLAEGNLISWGAYTNIVHTEEGITHGFWITAATLAGLEKVRTELIKQPPNQGMLAATKHRDYLLQSVVHRGKTAAATGGYLSVAGWLVKPGKGQEWRKLWEKNFQPVLDEMMTAGTLHSYGLDTEYAHTEDPGWHYVYTVSGSAEAEDKLAAAFRAAFEKKTEEERAGLRKAFIELTTPEAHRDFFALLSAYAHK